MPQQNGCVDFSKARWRGKFTDWFFAHIPFASFLRHAQGSGKEKMRQVQELEKELCELEFYEPQRAEMNGAEMPEPTVEELICQLRTGTVEQKCAAADELGQRGAQAIPATDILVAALSDQESFSDFGLGLSELSYWTYYVRESAVRALAKVNPAAAAPLALQVIAELRDKYSSGFNSINNGEGGSYVTFPDETIAAFRQASAERDKSDSAPA